MRFVRHLLAASVVVALVVGLAFLWKGSSAASLVSNDRDGRRFEQGFGDRPGAPPPSADGDRRFRRDDGAFSLGDIDELAATVGPLVLIVGVVAAVDQSRRGRRMAARLAVRSV